MQFLTYFRIFIPKRQVIGCAFNYTEFASLTKISRWQSMIRIPCFRKLCRLLIILRSSYHMIVLRMQNWSTQFTYHMVLHQPLLLVTTLLLPYEYCSKPKQTHYASFIESSAIFLILFHFVAIDSIFDLPTTFPTTFTEY